MQISIKSETLPFRIEIKGKINQIQYSWKIEPFLQHINTFDLHQFFIQLKKLITWSKENNINCNYTAPWLYRAAICLL